MLLTLAPLFAPPGIGTALDEAAGTRGAPEFHAPVGYDRASGIVWLVRGMPADARVLPAPQPAAIGELEESFDDITQLPGAGWAMINNSEPTGPSSWFQGNETIFPSHEGDPDAYIAANYESTSGNGDISNWLLTPEVTIVNGTTTCFWTRTSEQFEEFYDRLEVRMSVEGGSTDVGDTAESVGDFTDLLLSINPDLLPNEYPEEWTQFCATVRERSRQPVTGRFAFRYWVTDSGPEGTNGDFIGIDTVSVTVVEVGQASFNGLGDLEGGPFESLATDVSANGMVVVGQGTSADGFEAFRWTEAEGMAGLGDLPGGEFLSQATNTSADAMVVVGSSSSGNGTEAFRWEDGTMMGLGDLDGGDFNSVANGVSVDGAVVVGLAISASGVEAFRWEDGIMGGLGDLDGGFFISFANGISADGTVIVGQSHSENGFEAFRWANGAMEGLGDLEGGPFWSVAANVSADGAVVVGSSDSESGTEAFRWSEGVMQSLGDLEGGDSLSEANGVSADGSIVVGRSISGNGEEAFIWTKDSGMHSLKQVLEEEYDLDLDGWTLNKANDVSDDGTTIVGYGVNPDGHFEAWRAVLGTQQAVEEVSVARPNASAGSDTVRSLQP